MTRKTMMLALKRVYDAPTPGDGTRVLVFAARDWEHTNTVVLRDLLLHQAQGKGREQRPEENPVKG